MLEAHIMYMHEEVGLATIQQMENKKKKKRKEPLTNNNNDDYHSFIVNVLYE